jgi:competence protein ComEA
MRSTHQFTPPRGLRAFVFLGALLTVAWGAFAPEHSQALGLAAQAPDAPAFTMPAGAGKETFESVCSLCHNPIAVVGKHFTKAQWEAKITEMLQEEPDVTADERAAIVGYLSATFKPGGKIYVNIIPAKDLATALDLTIDQATAIVQQREKSGLFKTLDDLKAVPGIDAVKIDSQRERLAF